VVKVTIIPVSFCSRALIVIVAHKLIDGWADGASSL
jgi:hypothetical protein